MEGEELGRGDGEGRRSSWGEGCPTMREDSWCCRDSFNHVMTPTLCQGPWWVMRMQYCSKIHNYPCLLESSQLARDLFTY